MGSPGKHTGLRDKEYWSWAEDRDSMLWHIFSIQKTQESKESKAKKGSSNDVHTE